MGLGGIPTRTAGRKGLAVSCRKNQKKCGQCLWFIFYPKCGYDFDRVGHVAHPISSRPDHTCPLVMRQPLQLFLHLRVLPLRHASLRPSSSFSCTRHSRLLTTMAPSRTSSKRKVEDTDESATEEQPSQVSQSSKRARTEQDSQSQSQTPQFTNKVLPVHINLPPKQPGATRIASWNVSGLAAAEKKVKPSS